jgi:hypothetical protein
MPLAPTARTTRKREFFALKATALIGFRDLVDPAPDPGDQFDALRPEMSFEDARDSAADKQVESYAPEKTGHLGRCESRQANLLTRLARPVFQIEHGHLKGGIHYRGNAIQPIWNTYSHTVTSQIDNNCFAETLFRFDLHL